MKKLWHIIYVLSIVALCILLFRSCGSSKSFESMVQAKDDTLRTYINAEGQHVATIALMKGTVADLHKLNASKDSTLKRLQDLVDRHTLSATVHGTITGNTISSNTVTIVAHDTVKGKDSLVYVYPEYRDTVINKWENIKMIANRDFFKLDYKVYNKFDYKVSYNRHKWYKARVPEITVTNLNPNTVTNELKSFTVEPKKGQRAWVFLAGALIGAGCGIGVGKLMGN